MKKIFSIVFVIIMFMSLTTVFAANQITTDELCGIWEESGAWKFRVEFKSDGTFISLNVKKDNKYVTGVYTINGSNINVYYPDTKRTENWEIKRSNEGIALFLENSYKYHKDMSD